MRNIRLNQIGYQKESKKQFIYTGESQDFSVVLKDTGKDVLRKSLSKKILDEASNEEICRGDFSEVTENGTYIIQVGNEKSLEFIISDTVPVTCTDAILKAFYYQRCGMELTEEFAGPWKHRTCHHQPSYVFRQDAEYLIENGLEGLEAIDTVGGWHDAGDYGRYTVAAAKAVADLLLAYEHFSGEFTHTIHIPESKLEGPDILHETKYELDFMLKMQRPDGSVYTKVATRYFPGMIMPEYDSEALFIFDISSSATACFAASMSMASRVLQGFDRDYANKCLEAATRAYEWLQENPEPKLFTNPENIRSGEYGDVSDIDERYWAAAELYRTTGEEKYHTDFIYYYKKLEDKLSLGWNEVGGYGTIAYLYTTFETNKEVLDSLKQEWLSFAEQLKERSLVDGYGITLSMTDYKWGSTMILLNHCIHLIIANELLGKQVYDAIIDHNWDYLFGMNPMDISYVTGLGQNRVMHPHHRPSTADRVEEPVPGLILGGPCDGLYDEVAKRLLKGLPPAKCYVDHVDSYSTNEITVYWNSPAVFVGAYLSFR